jgi:hypothetical protein
VLQVLEQSDLAFKAGRDEGVLVIANDETFTGSMECMIVGQTLHRVRQIEDVLLAAMAGAKRIAAAG